MSSMKAWAHYYAAKGWYVFPLVPGRPEPAIQGGYHSASIDREQIEQWWTRNPSANIGVDLARSGMMAMDIDPRNGGDVTFAEKFAGVDSTLKAQSAGMGWHLFFTVPEGVRVEPQPGKGIDGKWNGYVVLPPSVRRGVEGKPDGDYVWLTPADALPSPMPGCLVAVERPIVERAAPVTGNLEDFEMIREALTYICDDDDFRDVAWRDIGMALHHWEKSTPGAEEAGWTLFEEWCQRDPLGHFDKQVRKRWDSFGLKENAVTLGSLLFRAQRAGWSGRERMSAKLAAAAFGAGPTEPAPWTTESQPGFKGTLDPTEILAGAMTSKNGDWFAEAWAGCKAYKVARTLAWHTASNCEAVMAIMQTGGQFADTRYVRGAIAEACRDQKEWKTITPEWRQWEDAPVIDANEVTRFEELRVIELEKNANDQMKDAQQLQRVTFENRLASFDGSSNVHWWTGRRWENAPDALARRHIARAITGMESKVNAGRVAGTLSILKDQIPLMGQPNPSSPYVFFQNCVLNAATGNIYQHDPLMRNTYLLNCDFNPGATCPGFLAWLHEIFAKDPGRVALLQEIFGWCLTTESLGIHKAVVMVGVQRAGKGTILSLLRRLMGDAAGAFQLADLVSDKVMAGMLSRNVVIDSDTASPDRRDARQVAGRFKAITANEPISIQMLYQQEPKQQELNCKLLLAANTVPTLWDDSGATANRWIPLAFDKSFLGREDAGLVDRLSLELEGIAVWAVEGLQRLMMQRRFTIPPTSRDELESLVDNASPLDRFIKEKCKIEGEGKVRELELWKAFEQWSSVNCFEPGSRRAFMHAFKDTSRPYGIQWKGSLRFDDGVYRGFKGFTLTNWAVAEPEGNIIEFPGKL